VTFVPVAQGVQNRLASRRYQNQTGVFLRRGWRFRRRGFRQYRLSRSAGVGPGAVLVAVVERADELTEVPFIVTEGLRTEARQKQLVEAGASQTMNSRHRTGHAVDLAALVGNQVRWDWPLYDKLAVAMKSAAAEMGIPITWGGDWKTLKDGPHFELDRKAYP